MDSIQDHVLRVSERITAACEAAGRTEREITLVAVSKTRPPEDILAAMDAGLTVFGENRVQEAAAKMAELPSKLEWHLIGHLQTNKIRQVLHCGFALVHSVDSERLLLALNETAARLGRVQPILIQVNVSGEGTKFGVKPENLEALLASASGCLNLEIRGLMTIPPFSGEPEKASPHFARLRELRDCARASSGFPLNDLSMGMSHDLEVAIREGATLVRVGTDLFGPRKK